MHPSCCDETRLLSLADAMARMQKQIISVTETESVPLYDATDRILAEPVVATFDVPPNANSAMDGYALRAQDAMPGKPLRLIGAALAGHPFQAEVTEGTCVRITTGAPIPKGADCVAMQENALLNENSLVLTHIPRAQENIRNRGEDIANGDMVIAQGKRLGPFDIGLLASLGMAEALVYRRLSVAVFSTGDELTPPGIALPSGNIYDSNRYGIIAALTRLAVIVIDLGLIPDQPTAIRAAVLEAATKADVIISSGGVSVGDADFVKEILQELGEIDFWKVAIKPGKPFAFGTLGKSYFFGLPGNPVSAMVTLHQLALPMLQYLSGEKIAPSVTLKIKAATSFKKRPGRTDFQRGRLEFDGSENQVHSVGAQGSGLLTSFSNANCYVILEQERGAVVEDEFVTVLPFDRYIG